jgi:hypothetical protein
MLARRLRAAERSAGALPGGLVQLAATRRVGPRMRRLVGHVGGLQAHLRPRRRARRAAPAARPASAAAAAAPRGSGPPGRAAAALPGAPAARRPAPSPPASAAPATCAARRRPPCAASRVVWLVGAAVVGGAANVGRPVRARACGACGAAHQRLTWLQRCSATSAKARAGGRRRDRPGAVSGI